MFDNEIERILFIDPLRGSKIEEIERVNSSSDSLCKRKILTERLRILKKNESDP